MNFSRKRILIIFSAIFALGICLYLLSGFVISYFLNVDRLQEIVKNQSGLELSLSKPKIRTLPNLSLQMSAEKLLVSLPDSNKNIFNGENLQISIFLPSLFFKNISISSFSAKKIGIDIARNPDGEFNFKKYLNNRSKVPFNLKLKHAKLAFNVFLFNFYDEKNQSVITFQSDKLFFDLKNNPKKLNIDTNAKLNICKIGEKECHKTDISLFINSGLPFNKHLDSKDTDFNIKISNFDGSYFKPYFAEFSNLKFDKLFLKSDFVFRKVSNSPHNKYFLDVKTDDIDVEFLYNNKKNSIKLLENAKLVTTFVAKNDVLEIDNSYFKSDNVDVLISGKLNNVKSSKPKPDIDINITNSDFMKFINLIPASLVDYKTDVINELINARPYAILNGKINVYGNYLRPDIKGRIDISDIYLFSRPKNFKTANVICDFIGDRVNVDVIVYGPNNQFVSVKGYSEIYGKQKGDYEVISSDNVDLAFAHKYLIPVQKVIGFKLGPLPYMKLSGNGKIHIKTNGTIYDALVYGKFFGKNITASLEGLNLLLQEGNIELDFNGKVINILDTRAKINNANFTLSGFADDYNNLDVHSKITNIDANDLLKIAKSSTLITPFSGDLKFINYASGKCDLDLFFKGKAKTLEGVAFLQDIRPIGKIILKNVNAILPPKLLFKNINGSITFSNDFVLNLKSDFGGAHTYISGTLLPNKINLTDKDAKFKINLNSAVNSMLFSELLNVIKSQNYFNNYKLKFLLTNTPISAIDFLFNVNTSIKGEIPLNYSNIDFSKLQINGSFAPVNSGKSKFIEFKNGVYTIKGSKVDIANSHIKLYDSDVYLSAQVTDVFRKPSVNGKVKANSVSLNKLKNFVNLCGIESVKVLLADFIDYKGTLSFDLKVKDNLPFGKLSFNNVSMYNKKQQIPLELISGGVNFSGDKISVDAFNFNYGDTPFYFDGYIKNVLDKRPVFNAMYSTNLSETSADKLINPYLVYPLKVKGEVISKGRLKGDFNNYSIISYLNLPQGTDISYMGANFGDIQYDRQIEANASFTKNTAKINGVKYIKYITSQNNKPTPVVMLKASGKLISRGKIINLSDFKIVTPNPTTAKIFNVIFKKSVLKQGLFTCDLNLNGNMLLPHATGRINFRNINIPLYSTKINDLDLNINKNVINALIRGKSFDSDVEINADIENKQTLPIIVNDLRIKSNKTSLSQLIEGISQLPKGSTDIVPGQPIILKPKDLIITRGNAIVKEVELYNIKANNLVSSFSAPNGDILNIHNMEFDIADGKVVAKGNFDVSSLLFDIDSIVYDCDANLLSESFLGLQNQIFGRTNAKINLKGKIPENAQDIRFVSGRVNFSVNNGKMPKLGSLEYLLRAGNLIKGGIFGLTLNNLLEVLTPYKTGEFSAIKGSFNVSDAKINSLEIFSKGNNLSLFIYGNYDIINDNAEIDILGRLSKNVSNVLGAAGNASLNTLFNTITGNKIKDATKSQIIENVNKIPLIEITGDDFRIFLAKIKGSLNSDDYVKSFNWLN